MKRKLYISFRPSNQKDRDFLFRLYDSTRDDVRTHGHHLTKEQQSEFIRLQFEAQDVHYKKHYPDAEFKIIQSKKKDVGRLYIEEWPSQLRIIDITILPEFRAKGIGTQVMSEIIEKAEKSRKSVSIHVRIDNPAIALYNRLGFELDGGTEVYHLMIRRYQQNKKKEMPQTKESVVRINN